MTFCWGLVGLGVSAFLSSTLLPGNSELVLSTFLYQWPASFWVAILVATLANSAGGLTSLLLGRLVPQKVMPKRAVDWLSRYGSIVLLLSGLPVIGDMLPLAAGWLRFPWLSCLVYLTIGKAVRYLILGYFMLIWVT